MTDADALSADEVRSSLLAHNYLPRTTRAVTELPPSVTTEWLTFEIANEVAGQAGLSRAAIVDKPNRPIWTSATPYRISRYDQTTRMCGIPHPVGYTRLVKRLCTSWPDMSGVATNTRSALRPRRSGDGRTIVFMSYDGPDDAIDAGDDFGEFSADSRGRFEAWGRANFKFEVRTDIKNFFPSFYSHSLPWAAYGRASAKRPDKTRWADQLDNALQCIATGETSGVHIGPGTSHYVTDYVLMKVDRSLEDKGHKNFKHWVDDYVYYTNSRDDAEHFIQDIEDALFSYRLILNERKVGIYETKSVSEAHWSDELRANTPGPECTDGTTISDYLDRVASLADRNADASVSRYGLSSLFSEPTGGRVHWISRGLESQLDKLWQISKERTECAPYAAQAWTVSGSSEPGPLLNSLLEAVKQRRSDATLWYLDALIQANSDVPRPIIEYMVKSPHWHVLPLALLVRKERVDAATLCVIQDYLSALPDVFSRDEHWILAHEVDLATAAKASTCDLDPFLARGLSLFDG